MHDSEVPPTQCSAPIPLTPNIKLVITSLLLLRPRTVGIHPTFDLRDAFMMFKNHRSNRNRATDQDRYDGNQHRSKTYNSIHNVIHSRFSAVLQSTEYLVELTGIEPVASWLQTRRSPS